MEIILLFWKNILLFSEYPTSHLCVWEKHESGEKLSQYFAGPLWQSTLSSLTQLTKHINACFTQHCICPRKTWGHMFAYTRIVYSHTRAIRWLYWTLLLFNKPLLLLPVPWGAIQSGFRSKDQLVHRSTPRHLLSSHTELLMSFVLRHTVNPRWADGK